MSNQIDYKYNVLYAFGGLGRAVGCQTESQAYHICEAITKLVEASGEELGYINIEDSETGEMQLYPVGRKIELEEE